MTIKGIILKAIMISIMIFLTTGCDLMSEMTTVGYGDAIDFSSDIESDEEKIGDGFRVSYGSINRPSFSSLKTVEEINTWMDENIEVIENPTQGQYDCWQSPLSTLSSGRGDNIDRAILYINIAYLNLDERTDFARLADDYISTRSLNDNGVNMYNVDVISRDDTTRSLSSDRQAEVLYIHTFEDLFCK